MKTPVSQQKPLDSHYSSVDVVSPLIGSQSLLASRVRR